VALEKKDKKMLDTMIEEEISKNSRTCKKSSFASISRCVSNKK